MKTSSQLFALIFSLLNFSDLSAESSFECRMLESGKGYLPFNTVTETFVGTGFIRNKWDCYGAIDAYRAENDLICSANVNGWAIYKGDSGTVVGKQKSYFKFLDDCISSVTFSNRGIVCAPWGTGAGVYDTVNGYFIGDYTYYSMEDCTWASSYAQDEIVCALRNGYFSSVFSRRSNRVVKSGNWDAKTCTKKM